MNPLSLSLINNYRMRKRAGGGLANDQFGAFLSEAALPYVGPLFNTVGALHGLVAGPASEEELREMDKHPGRSYLPGVGSSRLLRKLQAASDSSRARKHTISELLGQSLYSTLGAGIGAYIANRDTPDASLSDKLKRGIAGGTLGAMVGAVPSMLGATLALLRRNRSSAEQTAHDDNKSILANFIPGVAGYNVTQRMRGALRGEFSRNENPTD